MVARTFHQLVQAVAVTPMLFLIASSFPARGQEAKPAADDAPRVQETRAAADETPRGKVDLVMIARAPAYLSKKELEQHLKLGITRTPNCRSAADPVADPIDGRTFDTLCAVFRDVHKIQHGLAAGQLTRRRDSDNQWEIQLEDLFSKLENFEITYKIGDGPEKTETLKPGAEGDSKEKQRLRFYRPGLYVFDADPEWKLVGYKLTVSDRNGKVQPPKTFKWPETELFYLVQIKEFEGNIKDYFTTLTQADKVGTVYLRDAKANLTTFALQDFAGIIPTSGGVWEGNLFHVNVAKLPGAAPSSVWMLFPLTEEQKDSAIADLSKAQLTAHDLAEAIAAGKAGFPSRTAEPEGAATPLSPGQSPTWYQIPAVLDQQGKVDSFKRTFEVKDVDKWKADPKASRLFRLIAYEFSDGDARLILRVSVDDKQAVLWVPQEVYGWPIGLKQAK